MLSLKLFLFLRLVFTYILISSSTIKADQSTRNQQCDTVFWRNKQRLAEQYIDAQQQPCDDFWQYACGEWQAPSQLRFANPTDTLSTIKASNKHSLLRYFDQNENKFTAYADETNKRVAGFYWSCLDKRTMKTKSLEPIRVYTDVLQKITNVWPILQRNFSAYNVDKTFNWEYIAAEMRRYGAQSMISMRIQPNWQSSQQLIFYIMPPSFDLMKIRQSDLTYDVESVFLYQRYIKLLMMDLGVKVRQANQIADDIIEFEKSLMSLVDNERSVLLKEPQTLASLTAELPDMNIMKYFKTLLKNFDLPQDYADKMLIVADQVYLKRLAQFLQKSNAEIIAKYFLIQFLVNFEVNLHDDESYLKQKEDCLMQVNDFMPSELTKVYLQLHHANGEEFLQQTEQDLIKIFENLKLQFEKLLNNTTVFERDEATKKLSIEKLKAMKLLLPKLDTTTTSEFEQFDIVDNYDLNLINLSELKAKKQIKQVISHIVTDISSITLDAQLSLSSLYIDQSFGPLDVNAFYRLRKNAIELPIGILRAPLYDRCLKPAKIYGALVYIMAHELMHGFDYDGINYDKYGNVANSWGVKAIIKFGVKSNCYLNERYNNGYIAVNENIADSEGLRLALETFLETGMGSIFDQDDLKLFFISFAQTWCGARNVNNNNLLLHADHKERVNNVLGNFMEFADVFKCSPGSRMHPEEKCRIW